MKRKYSFGKLQNKVIDEWIWVTIKLINICRLWMAHFIKFMKYKRVLCGWRKGKHSAVISNEHEIYEKEISRVLPETNSNGFSIKLRNKNDVYRFSPFCAEKDF